MKHGSLLTELGKLENALWLVPLDPYFGSEESQVGLKAALDLIRSNLIILYRIADIRLCDALFQ